jgi:hypothetical protein
MDRAEDAEGDAMKNALYTKTLVFPKDAADGETATKIWVTQENNGYAVWRTSCYATQLLLWSIARDPAIEFGVRATLQTIAYSGEPGMEDE